MKNKAVEKSNIYQKTKKLHKDTVGEGFMSAQSGITLIALIITIIIMLILTIVTIKEVTGDGLIEKAKQAVDRYKEEQGKEENLINQFAENIDNQSNTTQPVPYTDEASYATYAEGLGYTVLTEEEYANANNASSGKLALPYGITTVSNSHFGNIMVGSDTLKGIIIPNTVETIESRAFYYCMGLNEIVIPSSVTNIGDYAFGCCSALASITIPNSVTSIENSVFYRCSALASIIIPNSVTSIGGSAFSYCTSLASITIPNSITSIGNNTFSNCSALTSITIPSSVTSIGGGAFGGCSALISITIPSSVTSIGGGAFGGCSLLTSITIDSNNPNYLSENGIIYNKNKTEIVAVAGGITNANIPSSVTSIGMNAFGSCGALTSITIPSSVTSIGNYAFSGCRSLASITVDSNNLNYSSENGILFNKDKTIIMLYPSGNRATEYSIPNSVTGIETGAFNGHQLSKVTFRDTEYTDFYVLNEAIIAAGVATQYVFEFNN